MQTHKTDNRTNRKLIRLALLATIAVVVAFGILVADTVTKEREASGTLTVELCKRGQLGKWDVVDRISAPVSISASILDFASGKRIKTAHVWEGRSEKGRRFVVRAGEGNVDFNPVAGLLALDLPLNFELNGKKFSFNSKISTESVSAPIGQLSGKKAVLQNRTLTAGLVGFSAVKDRRLVDELLNEGIAARSLANKGEAKIPDSPARLNEQFIVVVRAEGTARAK